MKNLKSQIVKILKENNKKKPEDVLKDYFSWGRDSRHIVDNTETMPSSFANAKNLSLSRFIRKNTIKFSMAVGFKPIILFYFKRIYSSFDETYQLMSDEYSKRLFAELILMALVKEKYMDLSSFTQEFINSYESASKKILDSNETLKVYKWLLRKTSINNPSISLFTSPTILTLHSTGRLYRYQKENVCIEVEKGDIIIDCGVGWGDTTVYLAARTNQQDGGWSYAFDILEEGMQALSEQCKINPDIKNITPVLNAVSDTDEEYVCISSPSPGARIVEEKTERKIQTITIDKFSKDNNLEKVNFIKMDIEGAEVPALKGASETIKAFKPKLAISVYHQWDDLLTIPRLIHGIRNDYNFYLDCTTGFGGEAVLYCK